MSGLSDLLARESDLVGEFVASLKVEQESLKQGEIDSLDAITRRKSELVEQLNAVEAQRNRFLLQAGHTADRPGMLAWLAKNRSDQAAAVGWKTLMALAREARELTELNGRLIAIRLQATNQALSALTQQAQRSSLYGPDGLTAARTGSRIIDAA